VSFDKNDSDKFLAFLSTDLSLVFDPVLVDLVRRRRRNTKALLSLLHNFRNRETRSSLSLEFAVRSEQRDRKLIAAAAAAAVETQFCKVCMRQQSAVELMPFS